MRLFFFILFNVFISCLLSAQGVTKSGQNTTTGINFVNKNGKIVNYQALTRYGQELFTGLHLYCGSYFNNKYYCKKRREYYTWWRWRDHLKRSLLGDDSKSNNMQTARTTDGSGSGSFTSNITGLVSGTTYYVRAYATNSVGTSYGNQVTFTTSETTL